MKTASRIFLTFSLLVFFAGVSFSQVATTTAPAKTATKSEVAPTGKTTSGCAATCGNHAANAGCSQGKVFVDKNADGKCDNCGTAGKCKESGNCGSKSKGCESTCGKAKGKGSCGEQATKACGAQPKK
jgi:hypothetical protein